MGYEKRKRIRNSTGPTHGTSINISLKFDVETFDIIENLIF
jgi:hypothetical protein